MFCTKNPTTQKELKSYKVPTVDDLQARRGDEWNWGSTWQPIHHNDLVTTLKKEAKERGLTVKKQMLGLSKDTHSIFGVIDFQDQVDADVPGEGISLSLGFRSDNLQRFTLQGVAGGRVFVCDNGMIDGEFAFRARHRKSLDLSEMVEGAFDSFIAQSEDLGAFALRLHEAELTREQASNILVEAVHRDIIAGTQLGKIDAEYREPRHEAFAPRTAWSLYNAMTEISKDWSPLRQEKALGQFSGLCLEVAAA